MATRQPTTTKKKRAPREPEPEKTKRRALLERAGIAALKGSGSAAAGATIGAVEATAGPKAAAGTKAVLAVAGLASEIFVDPDENPVLAEVGKASLHSAAAVQGYQAGKAAAEKAVEAKRALDHQRMLESIKADLKGDDEDEAAKPNGRKALGAGKATVPVPKKTKDEAKP